MPDDAMEHARALVTEHGRGAIQHLIDLIIPAVRAQDETAISLLDRQLRYVDKLLEEQERERRFGSRAGG
jgi:hypothetical protein